MYFTGIILCWVFPRLHESNGTLFVEFHMNSCKKLLIIIVKYMVNRENVLFYITLWKIVLFIDAQS